MKHMSKGNYLDSNKTVYLALPSVSTIFFPLKERKKYQARWRFGFDPAHPLSCRFQSSEEHQLSNCICCHTGLLLSRPGKSCSSSYFRSEALWALFQAGQSALLPVGCSTETCFRWELQGSTSETQVTRPPGRCIRSERWGKAIAGQIQILLPNKAVKNLCWKIRLWTAF